MSQLRKDPVCGRWVIIAGERSKRPDAFRGAKYMAPVESPDSCPFCEGREGKTPPEVFALRADSTPADSPGWRVRVVPNKFPALARGPRLPLHEEGLLAWMEGLGVHEVVIETPVHGLEMSDLRLADLRDVFWTYRERIRAIESEEQYRYVQVFKNKGREAGASLSHPHTQLIATPIVPKRVEEELQGAERYALERGECIFCRTIRDELERGERVVLRNEHFCVLVPFASRFPFEMQVLPLRHSPRFSDTADEELGALAEAMRAALSRLKETLSDPPYNFLIHQAPNPRPENGGGGRLESASAYHWHVEIIPVLTRVAGFELGTGFYINPVFPETAAEILSLGRPFRTEGCSTDSPEHGKDQV